MIYEGDLFYSYVGQPGSHTVTCNSCGCLVPNEHVPRQAHVAFHIEVQGTAD